MFRPGQRDHDVQPVAQRRRFSRVRMHAFELLQLAINFLFDGFRHFALRHLLAVLRDVFGQFVAFAKFLLDGFQLLAQIKLALRAVNLAFGLRVDLLLDGQHFDLFVQKFVDAMQARIDIEHLEHRLRVFDFEFQVGRGEVGQSRRVFDRRDDGHHFGRDVSPQPDSLFERRTDVARQSFEFQVLFRRILFQFLDVRLQEVLIVFEEMDFGARDTLHQDADASVGQLQHSHDDGHRAHVVKIALPRLFLVGIFLRGEHDHAVFGQRLVNSADRAFAADKQRHDHERKDHDVAQRQHW
ncbi:MAG: hypothetical protein JMDDDDMK_00266 [Acidobacteria bacterium]|nr:hypothetical protein [Acidobacteriota bacterium]